MDRRTLVRAAGTAGIAGLAGCLGGCRVGPTGTPGTETPDGRTVSIQAVDGFPASYPVSIDIVLPTPGYAGRGAGGDGSHPASVAVTLTDGSDERKRYGLGLRTVFSTVYSDCVDTRCWLPTSTTTTSSSTPGSASRSSRSPPLSA